MSVRVTVTESSSPGLVGRSWITDEDGTHRPTGEAMAHPVHLIKRYLRSVEDGKYSKIRHDIEEAAVPEGYNGQSDTERIAQLEHELLHAYRRIANVTATNARVQDKINLIRDIVASGVHSERGETLGDDDYLLILAGWAAEQRGRFG